MKIENEENINIPRYLIFQNFQLYEEWLMKYGKNEERGIFGKIRIVSTVVILL
jgi:hypothetical protein